MPVFLSQRVRHLVVDSIVKLIEIEGHRYDDVMPVEHPDGGYAGWHGEAIFAFHGAKERFCDAFAEDIASDVEQMIDSFKEGQRDVLEPDGLWTDAMEAMSPEAFWEAFIPPEPDCDSTPCGKLPFADTPQGHFQKRWNDNAGDLFSLQITARFRARDDVGNATGADEIAIIAGLNGDYVLEQRDYLIRSWTRVIPLSALDTAPRLLLSAFEEADAFLASLG